MSAWLGWSLWWLEVTFIQEAWRVGPLSICTSGVLDKLQGGYLSPALSRVNGECIHPCCGILFSHTKGKEYWFTLSHGWTLSILCWVKESRHKGPHVNVTPFLWIGKCTDWESRGLVAKSEKEGGRGMVLVCGNIWGGGWKCLRIR